MYMHNLKISVEGLIECWQELAVTVDKNHFLTSYHFSLYQYWSLDTLIHDIFSGFCLLIPPQVGRILDLQCSICLGWQLGLILLQIDMKPGGDLTLELLVILNPHIMKDVFKCVHMKPFN